MAENKINIAVGADTSEFQQNMQLLQNAVAKLPNNVKPGIDKVSLAVRTLEKDFKNLAATEGIQSEATKDALAQLMKMKEAQAQLSSVTQGSVAPITNASQAATGMSSGVRTLNMSVMQLSREMPNFATNLNTGFMSISNNLPYLIDGLKTFRAEQAAVVASGGQAQSLFSALTSSTMMFNLAIGAGITALTVFGPKLVEMISGTDELANANDAATQSYERLRKTVEDYILTDQQRAIAQEKTSYEQAKNAGQKELEVAQMLINIKKEQQIQATQDDTQRLIKAKKYVEQVEEAHQRNMAEIQKRNKPKTAKEKEENTPDWLQAFQTPHMDKRAPKLLPTTDFLSKFGELKKVGQDSFISLSDNAKRMGGVMTDVFDSISSQLEALAVQGFAQFGEMIGESMAGANVDAGAAAGMLLATIASTIGQGMIAMGLPMLFAGVTAGEGAALIAGGTAMMAVAGALKANSKPSGAVGGGGYSSSYGSNSMGANYTPTATTVFIDGRVRGNDLVIATYNQNLRNGRIK